MSSRRPWRARLTLGLAAVSLAALLIGATTRDRGSAESGALAPAPAAPIRPSHFERAVRDVLGPLGEAGVARSGVWATIGRSAQGRPIRLTASGMPGSATRVLVFGCIHGTECAAMRVPTLGPAGCPPAHSDVLRVPNLNPDGLALGTRINGRGVDLNRNFPAGWKPIGKPGGAQHSGPRPFSEPETRLAARLIRRVRPNVTIWFHQQEEGEMVRAWGGSVPIARRFARLSHLPFHRLPWLHGTAPNWQNHRFPGSSSFVVELAPGPITEDERMVLGSAIGRLAEELGRD